MLTLPGIPTGDDGEHDFILTFSPDETFAAFVRRSGNVATVLDLQSDDSWLAIDTRMEVECLGMVGDTVIAAEKEIFVT